MSERRMNIKNGVQKIHQEYVMKQVRVRFTHNVGKVKHQHIQSLGEVTTTLHGRREIRISNQVVEMRKQG